jgi:hypothetical protein
VNFNNKEEIERDFKFEDYLNKMQNKIYYFENNPKNNSFWERFGATGLLVDINKFKGFKNGLRK